MTYSGADLLVPAGIKCDGTSRHKQKHIYIGRVMKFGLFLGIFMSLKQFNVDIFILWVLWRYVWCFNILLMFGIVEWYIWDILYFGTQIWVFRSGIFGILWGFVTYLWVLWRYV